MAFWVYILRCADNSYYTGHTDNLDRRIHEHQSGAIAGCYTHKRRPLQLVFSQDFPTREEALASEQQIKGWSRKKKESMMNGDWAEVSRLARLKSTPGRTEPKRESQSPARPNLQREPQPPVRPEPVEGSELVEGRNLAEESGQRSAVHPSTSSGRTAGRG